MNERNLEVLGLYDIEVKKVAKGRGAYLIWSDKGFFRLSEYEGNGGRLSYEERLLAYIEEVSSMKVDRLMRTREEGLFGEDVYGTKYILKRWYEGNECDVKRHNDLLKGVHTLAELHKVLYEVKDREVSGMAPVRESVISEYGRYNDELKRVRNFMRKRTRKTQFEYDVLSRFDEYYGYADEARKKLEQSTIGRLEQEATDRCSVCHGAYNYHNIILLGQEAAVVNFDHSAVGLQITDLYLYIRKVMEKHDWNIQLGHQLLERYDHVRAISDEELKILKLMLSYPEKYRKLLNQYNNSNKSWIPDKNALKLGVLYKQQELKMTFAKSL